MTDEERRLWMAPRRDSAAQDQLPQPGYATDGRPSGDLQPGTQRKQAASSDSARQTAQAVALAVGVTSLPGSPDGPCATAGARHGTTFPTEAVHRNNRPPSATGRCHGNQTMNLFHKFRKNSSCMHCIFNIFESAGGLVIGDFSYVTEIYKGSCHGN